MTESSVASVIVNINNLLVDVSYNEHIKWILGRI